MIVTFPRVFRRNAEALSSHYSQQWALCSLTSQHSASSTCFAVSAPWCRMFASLGPLCFSSIHPFIPVNLWCIYVQSMPHPASNTQSTQHTKPAFHHARGWYYAKLCTRHIDMALRGGPYGSWRLGSWLRALAFTGGGSAGKLRCGLSCAGWARSAEQLL